jgi:hypothetical protein
MTKDKIRETEGEYARQRADNSEVVRENKVIKGELGVIQNAVKKEIEINEENTLRLETIKRSLIKVTDEIMFNQGKEDQLTSHLKERK